MFGKYVWTHFWAFQTILHTFSHTFSPTRISKTLKQHYSNSFTKHPLSLTFKITTASPRSQFNISYLTHWVIPKWSPYPLGDRIINYSISNYLISILFWNISKSYLRVKTSANKFLNISFTLFKQPNTPLSHKFKLKKVVLKT